MDTDLVIRQVCDVSTEADAHRVLEAREAVLALKQETRKADQLLKGALIDWIEANGDLTDGERRWYVARVKSVKPRNVVSVADAVLTATSGDLEAFCETLGASPFKQGYVKGLLGEEAHRDLFHTETRKDLKTGKPKKEVREVHPLHADLPSLPDLQDAMWRLHEQMNVGMAVLRDRAEDAAIKDAEHREEWAKAYLQAEGTVREKECEADLAVAEQRIEADIAKALERSAKEALHTMRQQQSALQSLANALRSEIELAGRAA